LSFHELFRLAAAGDPSIYHLFCVFDGHNGDEAATFMARHVPAVRANLCLHCLTLFLGRVHAHRPAACRLKWMCVLDFVKAFLVAS
jgi:hypothetical protein